jgi:hypothetical protein
VGESNLVFWNGYILCLYEIVNRNQKARRANKAHIKKSRSLRISKTKEKCSNTNIVQISTNQRDSEESK